jgi:microcystin-dependent protein
MSDVFLGEIRPFAFNFAPRGFLFCDGQLLAISQFTALFSLLGTTYGGNGTTNFQLPNLQGMAPMHQGSTSGSGTFYSLGQTAGASSVQLTTAEMPQHNHDWQVSESGPLETATPNSTTWLGIGGQAKEFTPNTSPTTPMAPQTIGLAGSSSPHQNLQPYLAINLCIAINGIFPARN